MASIESMSSHSLSTQQQYGAAAAMLAAQPVQVRVRFRAALHALQVPEKYWTVLIIMTFSGEKNYAPELKQFIGPAIQAHQSVIFEVLELATSIGSKMKEPSESSQIDSDSDKESSCAGGGGGGNGDGGGSNNTCL